MEFIRSVLAQDEAVTVSTRVTYDLPVNPLSHLIFTLRFLNDTATITNYSAVAAALAQVANLAVEFKGSSVLSGTLTDLAILAQTILRKPIALVNQVRTDNDARAISVILPFGRSLYNPDECFPAVRRGDLRLVIDYAAAQTGIDGLSVQIETVEIPGAGPKQFIKATTISRTLTSGIGNDVDLPIGNAIIGVLMFGTTIPTGASWNATIGRTKLLVDNTESHYSETNWESLHSELLLRYPYNPMNDAHTHAFNGAAAAYDSTLQPECVASLFDRYAYLDFDPTDNGLYALITEGKSRVHLRITAEASDAARFMPIEIMVAVAGA